MSNWVDKEIKTIKDAEKYQVLEAEELLLRFHEEHGRPAETIEEMEAWVAAGGGGERPIKPRDSLFLRPGNGKGES